MIVISQQEKKALIKEVEAQGFAIRIDMWPERAIYYKRDGEAMPNLPADPYSMRRYLQRGFTLAPPRIPALVETPKQSIKVDDLLTCPDCGFKAKNNTGFTSHMLRKIHGSKGGINNVLPCDNRG